MPKHGSDGDSNNGVQQKKFCSTPKPDLVVSEKISPTKKNVINIAGEKFIDTEGGFLLEEKTKFSEEIVLKNDDFSIDEFTCTECKKDYHTSFLKKYFDFPVCDGCRDSQDRHSLITRTDAKTQYLLKDCDLDKRDPPLKFILRKNPHNVNWGQMKLYLHLQVEKRAIEVHGSLEELEEAHNAREEKRIKAKTKKYNQNLKSLRMEVRSSLFNRTTGPTHQHEFGPEKYNESDDTYSKTCLTCKFVETYEKM